MIIKNDKSINQRSVTRQTFAERYEVSLRQVDEWISRKMIPILKLSKRCVRIPLPEADNALFKYCQNAGCTHA